MKAKWNEWKNSIKQMRVDKRWFDITCKIISFPFVLLYHILNFCLTFSKVILNVILLVLIIAGMKSIIRSSAKFCARILSRQRRRKKD